MLLLLLRLCCLCGGGFDNNQPLTATHTQQTTKTNKTQQKGAGKTAIAEAAAAAVLASGRRVVYTTPLKALSNQKLLEVRARFGGRRCGLQTGDTSLNTDAEVVIMTTEILRNIMYRTAETTAGAGGGRKFFVC